MSLLPPVAAASYQSYLAAMFAGFVVGAFGHIYRSTTLIVIGILLIGGTSVALLASISTS